MLVKLRRSSGCWALTTSPSKSPSTPLLSNEERAPTVAETPGENEVTGLRLNQGLTWALPVTYRPRFDRDRGSKCTVLDRKF